jgi:phosphoribosyl-AMP cyclohydrolase / phosphoribosyl-ATP pyrophosphohydrolase
MAVDPDTLQWDASGLVPVVVQDAATNAVLMLAYMDRSALAATDDTGEVQFWSRSRQELWRKGATSGNTLSLVSMVADCDNDALLVTATPQGPTCHTGEYSCFGPEHANGIDALWTTISERLVERSDGSYTASLVARGTDEVARKVAEEASEVVIAAKNHQYGGDSQRVVEESADLIYHLLVLLAEREIDLQDVECELDKRASQSG